MALQKSVTLPTGASATYHTIGTVTTYFKEKAGHDVVVNSYGSAQVRAAADGAPLATRTYRVGGYQPAVPEGVQPQGHTGPDGKTVAAANRPAVPEVPFNGDATRKDLYAHLKAHPDFEGSTDI